ncbi:MAG: hypothetical protein OXC30_03375 [Alphaproteobacteria bacterium]|nr:hypothetical protein [Alphaproteobacteria bacterium]
MLLILLFFIVLPVGASLTEPNQAMRLAYSFYQYVSQKVRPPLRLRMIIEPSSTVGPT